MHINVLNKNILPTGQEKYLKYLKNNNNIMLNFTNFTRNVLKFISHKL